MRLKDGAAAGESSGGWSRTGPGRAGPNGTLPPWPAAAALREGLRFPAWGYALQRPAEWRCRGRGAAEPRRMALSTPAVCPGKADRQRCLR